MEIADSCFPHSVYWSPKNPRAYRCWEFSINSKVSEVWVYESATEIQGFSLNILNEKDWASARSIFNISSLEKLVLFLKNPRKGYFFIRKYLSVVKAISLSETVSFKLTPRLFVDLFAVVPNSRHKGVAAALLENNVERAEQLGRKAVVYNVDKNNLAMLGLMEKYGYVAITCHQKQITFAKHIKTSNYC